MQPPEHPSAEGETVPMRWELRRNCALTPRQSLCSFGLMCVIGLPVGLGFSMAGYGFVALFVGLELVAAAVAMLVYARHACDRETVALVDGMLHVEQHDGTAVQRQAWRAAWVRVDPLPSPGALVPLHVHGVELALGRHVPPHHRARFAHELRAALRHA